MNYLCTIYEKTDPYKNNSNKCNTKIITYTTNETLAKIAVKSLNKKFMNNKSYTNRLVKIMKGSISKYYYKRTPFIKSKDDITKLINKLNK